MVAPLPRQSFFQMNTYGPFHRSGSPGGPGCRVAVLPVQGRTSGGALTEGSLLDGGEEASELELLRTVAAGLGVHWGHDSPGWWAMVPRLPVSGFISGGQGQESKSGHALFREDDNGARFLIAVFDSREKAEQRAAELAHGGHKQHYFIEQATPE